MLKFVMISNPSAISFIPDASVEAEFGSVCVEGAIITMAHHGVRANNPAPCNWPNVPVLKEGTVLLSHIDLDTVGGCMALLGVKPKNNKFWAGAELVDVRGPHHAHELDDDTHARLCAYWAWNAEQPRAERVGADEIRDVTADVHKHVGAILDIIGEPKGGDLLKKGLRWEAEQDEQVNERCVKEYDNVRLFVTGGIFCSAGYWNGAKMFKATVALNTRFDAITVAFEDGGKQADACKIVQEAWGPLAGGRAGIAGSPRGQAMTYAQAEEVAEKIDRLLSGD